MDITCSPWMKQDSAASVYSDIVGWKRGKRSSRSFRSKGTLLYLLLYHKKELRHSNSLKVATIRSGNGTSCKSLRRSWNISLWRCKNRRKPWCFWTMLAATLPTPSSPGLMSMVSNSSLTFLTLQRRTRSSYSLETLRGVVGHLIPITTKTLPKKLLRKLDQFPRRTFKATSGKPSRTVVKSSRSC